MYIFSLQLDLLTAALHQAPTLIDCQIFKDHSYPAAALRFRFTFATASSFAASDKSFCLSAAEKRDYEALRSFRQQLFSRISKNVFDYLLLQNDYCTYFNHLAPLTSHCAAFAFFALFLNGRRTIARHIRLGKRF
jgi:hypothetical protein